MKTYRSAGTATEWSPCGVPLTVTRVETVHADGTNFSIPCEIRMSGETNKKAIRRVMIQATARIPGALLNDLGGSSVQSYPKGDTPLSVHMVFQGPQLAFMRDAASLDGGLLDLLMDRLSTDLLAVVTNVTIPSSADSRHLSGLVARALVGSLDLDVVAGSYGTASA